VGMRRFTDLIVHWRDSSRRNFHLLASKSAPI
jgi:hypothetical protein